MYESYWNLNCRPFDDQSEPRFFVPTSSHQAALLKLKYQVESPSGAALLMGANGSGKTTVLRQLECELADEFRPLIHVLYPRMSPTELLSFLAAELGAHESLATGDPVGTDRVIRQLRRQLATRAEQGRQTVIVVDDAHMIDDEAALEALQLLLNLQQDPATRFSLLLAGQPSLGPRIKRVGQLNDRIGMRAGVVTLSESEVVEYVTRRLGVAGCSEPIFDGPALTRLAAESAGVPRRLNRLCDMALLVGYADGLTSITGDVIDGVRNELDLPLAA